MLRLASGPVGGQRVIFTSLVAGSTRTMAFRPPSVTQAAPSGPTITPWGAEPAPRGMAWPARGGIEPAERAGPLGGVPDRAVGRGRDVVRMVAPR